VPFCTPGYKTVRPSEGVFPSELTLAARAARIKDNPIGPLPKTARAWPGPPSQKLKAWRAIESGSVSMASAIDTVSGTGRQFDAGMMKYSAKAPSFSPGLPRKRRLRQVWGRPVRHWSHVPQETAGSTATRSPGLSDVTRDPTASTTAETSWPRTAG
jgi:hypothetical protein